MMKTTYLFLSCLTLLVSGTPQITTCPSDPVRDPVCLSQPVTYECNSGSNTLIWRVLDTNGVSVGGVSYTEFGDDVGETDSIGSQFNTVLTVDGSSLVSNITFTPTLSISNYTLQCGDPSGTFMNCSIVIADIPIAVISPNFGYGNPIDRIITNWALLRPNPCVTHYILMRTSSTDSISYTFTTPLDGGLSLPVLSLNDTLYTFSVLAVDTGGRSLHIPFNNVTLIPDVPKFVTDLTLTQTDYPTDINDTVNIIVSWNPPPELSPEPVLEWYHVYYNVSDVPQNITQSHVNTSRTLSGFAVGSEYTVGVAAANIFGTGPTTSATITILATPPPPPEIPSTSTVDFTSSFTSGISATPSMTPSSSSMTPPTTQASSFSTGAIVGIVIAIIVLGALIILGIAIVCYVKKKNQDKPAPSVAPQNIGATNYVQVDHSVKSSSSKKQAPPKPPKSTSPEADNQVVYSAIQKLEASHNPPPQEGTEYADLDHSASASGRHNQRPKEPSNQVQYSDVSHNSRR